MICNKESIILKNMQINKNFIEYNFIVSDGLKKYFNRNNMFIEYSGDIDLKVIPNSILVIPFISSILPIAWLTDSIFWVEEIDKTFYHSIQRIKNAFQEIYDYYPLKGSLVPAKIIENNYQNKRESLILFSGGVDAHTTYLRNMRTNPLLFNVQGWYKNNPNEVVEVADQDIININRFCKEKNKDFKFAKSNFATIINTKYFRKKIEKKLKDTWWHGFQHSMSFISIAIPVCYFFGIKTIYIASSFSIGDKGRCASYPTTDSEFAFANIGGVCHDGFELSRQDKVKIIVDYQKEIQEPYSLKVCTFEMQNCCICEKCVRTILGIIAENGDPRKFGFIINSSLIEFFKVYFINNLIFFDVKGEKTKHWGYIEKRMKENYDNLDEKEFVDWFLNTDFMLLRKKMLLKYRLKNFVSLFLKRLRRICNEKYE